MKRKAKRKGTEEAPVPNEDGSSKWMIAVFALGTLDSILTHLDSIITKLLQWLN